MNALHGQKEMDMKQKQTFVNIIVFCDCFKKLECTPTRLYNLFRSRYLKVKTLSNISVSEVTSAFVRRSVQKAN